MDTEQRNQMVLDNMGLVFSVANKLRNSKAEHEDLIQEGVIALTKCCEKFDPNKGFCFSSYAMLAIRREMIRYIRKLDMIRLPDYLHSASNEHLKTHVDSIEEEFEGEKREVKIPYHTDIRDRIDDESQFNKIMSVLKRCNNKRKFRILEKYLNFGSGIKEHTLRSFGKRYRLSGERIRQIIQECARNARPELEAIGVNYEN